MQFGFLDASYETVDERDQIESFPMTETSGFPMCLFANHVDLMLTWVLADHTLLNMIYISSE